MKDRFLKAIVRIILAFFLTGTACQARDYLPINSPAVLSSDKATLIGEAHEGLRGNAPPSHDNNLVLLAGANTTVTLVAAQSGKIPTLQQGELDFIKGEEAVKIEELVILTGEEATTEEIFGPDSGNIHPFISIEGSYTDNVYNINIDEQTNFLTSISPGVWLITPKAERVPVRISSYNTSVGGSRFTMPSTGAFDRFQAYLLGGLDYKIYSLDSDLDYTAWGVEGLIQYNLPAGISFRIMDKFISDRDRIEIGSFQASDFIVGDQGIKVIKPSRIREFISNQAIGFVNFEMSERFSALLTYSNFYLDYDDPQDDWLDRTDNVLSLDLNYHHSPKTSVFLEGKKAVVDYDTADYNDSEDMFLFAGIKYHKSIKTQLLIKGGYQVKSFEENSLEGIDRDDLKTFAMEAWFNYRYSDRTKMSFKLAKAIEETDTALSTGKDTISGRFYFDHEFTERLRINFTARYEHYDYEGYYLAGEPRDDHFIGLIPAIQYDFRNWLMTELSYSYEQRDSNYDFYDFTTNTVFLSINLVF